MTESTAAKAYTAPDSTAETTKNAHPLEGQIWPEMTEEEIQRAKEAIMEEKGFPEEAAETMARERAMLIRQMRETLKWEALASTDALTGLNNRRHFDEQILKELERAERYGHDLSLVLIDIDHFKKVNDSLGHLIGDETLQILAGIIGQEIRKPDFAARYGGEEFMVILPHTGENEANQFAERLKKMIKTQLKQTLISRHPEKEADIEEVVSGTVSIGIGAYYGSEKKTAPKASELIDQADKAMYYSKQSGRNRVTAYSDELANVVPYTRAEKEAAAGLDAGKALARLNASLEQEFPGDTEAQIAALDALKRQKEAGLSRRA